MPKPLQHFGNRTSGNIKDTLQVAFPPNGAVLAGDEDVALKLRGGAAPFTVLINNAATPTKQRHREFTLTNPGLGFSRISVIDATGQSQSIQIQLTR